MPQEFKPFPRPEQDGRRKIMPEEHEQIKRDYQELQSYQKTADLWGISKRAAIFIVNPDKYKEFQRKRYEKKPWLDYYNREEHTKTIAKHRKKKKELGLYVRKSYMTPEERAMYEEFIRLKRNDYLRVYRKKRKTI